MSTYDITINSPLGETPATIILEDGAERMTGKGGSGPLENYTTNGKEVSFKVKIERPVPMNMSFDGQFVDDTLSGTVKFGMVAKGTFSGRRSA